MFKLNTASGARKLCAADILTSQAELSLGRKDHWGAIGYLRKALDIKERFLGRNHASVALTLNNLASVYSQIGAPVARAQAVRLLQRAIGIQLRSPGLLSSQAAATFHNMARVRQRDGRLREATVLAWWVYEIRLKTCGPASIEVAHILDELVTLYDNSGKDPQDVVRRANMLRQAEKASSNRK